MLVKYVSTIWMVERVRHHRAKALKKACRMVTTNNKKMYREQLKIAA